MTVPFNQIPTSIRVPLFYAEMDNSQANYGLGAKRSLLIGQKLAGGTAVAGTPYLVATTDQAIALFGRGSMLARMHAIYRANDLFGEVWVIPLDDAGPGVAATGTITVTGPATANGVIDLYVAGQRVQVPVISGDTAATIAAAMNTAINASTDLPITSTVAGAVVTPLCRWKGQTGNDITLQHAFRGYAGGEVLPAGVGLVYVAMSTGAANPSLAPAIAAMGDEEYDFVIHPYTDSTSLDAVRAEMSDTVGRWSFARQVYGHAYSALRGTLGSLVTAGLLRNDPHHCIAAIDADTPSPVWEYASAYGARNAVFISANVARPVQSGDLNGLLVPRAGKRFIQTERQSLLNNRIATSYVSGGMLKIERAITTYGLNSNGQADASYLDSETLHQSAEFLRRMRSVLTSKYGRHSLADNGTPISAGGAVVTPAVLEGELDAEYLRMQEDGLVENFKAWQAARRVERDPNNPNRVNILLTPDYVNQLRIIAAVNQFRLQFAA